MPRHFDAIVVGAGFAGLYALHRLRGDGLSVRVLEQGDGVGGTWYWNRYPGARCDIESLDYSYSFSEELEQEWTWSERYPAQPEILRYLDHVADRFELRRDIELNTRVERAHYDGERAAWDVTTANGTRYSATHCIMACGCLSTPHRPAIDGLEDFEGAWHHTARWPHGGVDLAGKRVGVIGTGSTGIQLIPRLAEQAEHLYVFQRTANFSMPAHNRPLDPELQHAVKARYSERRRLARESLSGVPSSHPEALAERSALEVTPAERERAYEQGWETGGIGGVLLAFSDITVNAEANATAADFVREKIRTSVRDPATAEALCPTTTIGTKRICVDTDYYAAYNRDNVTLVDVGSAPIVRLSPRGIETADRDYELDVIVFATGFDAMTGALLDVDIRGREGLPLREKWSSGPRTYLGLMTAGFPNLFFMTGPGSPSVLSNMVVSIEQHVEWIADAVGHLRECAVEAIEALPEAEDAWVAHVDEIAQATLFARAKSWYVGANIPGKPRVFMPYLGGVGAYRARCDEVAANGYEGFALTATPIGSR